MAPQAYADPYSGLARGLSMGADIKTQTESMMLQKAESKLKQDMANLGNAFDMLNIKGLPDEKKREIFNTAIVPLSKKLNPRGGLTEIAEWPKAGDGFAKKLKALAGEFKAGKLSPKDYIESLNLTATEAQEAGKKLDISGLVSGAKEEGRKALLQRPSVPGLPAETQSFKSGLMGGDVSLTRPEVPELKGGLTPEGRGMGELERQQYIEKGTLPKKAKAGKEDGGAGISKKSKDAFAYIKTVLQKPNEYGTYILDDETARAATLMIDKLVKDNPEASPQRIGELAIRQGKLADVARERAGTGISREPKAIDRATAQQFLQQAGGDKERARQLAKEAGYQF